MNFLEHTSIDEQYITALYWAVQTMCTVGYGDFAPKNSDEQIYVTVCMLISAGIYSLSLENVEKIIRKHDMLAEQFRDHMLYVGQFMRNKQFPPALRSQVW